MIIYILIAFISLTTLELLFPKRKFSKSLKIKSYITNILILGSNNILMYLLSITSIYLLSKSLGSFNLLNFLDYNNIYISILVIIFLDLLIYFWHFLNHKVSFLWMFHKTHHTEVYLNTSSGFRFHIGELVLSIIFKSVLYIVILGIPVELILISENIIILASLFHHTNITFKGEKILSKIMIVPYLHQVHHSRESIEHDSNYGVLLSFWDKIFRTIKYQEITKIGLDKIKFQNFLRFLKFGFKWKY